MKKVILALVVSFMMVGCMDMDYNEKIPDAVKSEIMEALKGDSAFEIWLSNDNNGTVADFLNSLVGTNGADGVCPNCESNITEPNMDGTILMTFKTGMAIDNVKVGYLTNGNLAMMSDANVTEENGLTSIVYSLDLNESATYIMGLEFTN